MARARTTPLATMTVTPGRQEHRVRVGLGTALRRHQLLMNRYRSGTSTEFEDLERRLLEDALDELTVNVNASCVAGEDMNQDGIPDTMQFFELMALGKCDCEVRPEPPMPAQVGKKRKVT